LTALSKLILVTATHHPYHQKWLELTQRLSQELGVEYEVREEDYLFAIEHGKTDDLGMAGLPQLFAQLADGRILLLLWEIPLNEKFEADFEKARVKVLESLKEIVK